MLKSWALLVLSLGFGGWHVHASTPCKPCADKKDPCRADCERNHSVTNTELENCLSKCGSDGKSSESSVSIDPKNESDLNRGGKTPNS